MHSSHSQLRPAPTAIVYPALSVETINPIGMSSAEGGIRLNEVVLVEVCSGVTHDAIMTVKYIFAVGFMSVCWVNKITQSVHCIKVLIV